MTLAQHPALRRLALICALAALAPSSPAQMSLASAVSLAVGSHPRVKSAEDDVTRAQAQLTQSHAVFIPSITAGAGIGESYGYSPNPPSLGNVSAGSLVYNGSQIAYIHSARAGLNAAMLALQDVRESVAEDTALAFVALAHDEQREAVIRQQADLGANLVRIVQQRVDAGQDTQIGLTQARLSAAQFHLLALRAEDDTAVDREHLARLLGLPTTGLHVDPAFPAAPTTFDTTVSGPANPGIAAAFASAEARRQQALGDAHYLFRPQLNFFAQYNRYATFTDSFAQLQALKCNGAATCPGAIGANEGVFGIQLTVPLFDRFHQAKARESAADAAHAFHDAQSSQLLTLDSESRLRRSLTEIHAQMEVSNLDHQLAQQQLDVLLVQLQSGNPDGPQMTPKDEQNARIAEREKTLSLIDSNFQLQQAEIHLLRQTGGLEAWLKTSIPTPPPPTP